jgi:2-polyprenyl-3-methyl-5-hydroxy-6-metoxy-1,4-benzoquinol methylase
MHVIEHLDGLTNLMKEVHRVLTPGGRAYFETPHVKTLDLPSAKGKFTLNFYDDSTHTKVVKMDEFSKLCEGLGFKASPSGISRNLFFAATYPFLYFAKESRKRFTAQVHWIGWSAFVILTKQGPG